MNSSNRKLNKPVLINFVHTCNVISNQIINKRKEDN